MAGSSSFLSKRLTSCVCASEGLEVGGSKGRVRRRMIALSMVTILLETKVTIQFSHKASALKGCNLPISTINVADKIEGCSKG